MARIDLIPPVYNSGILVPEQFGAAGDGTVDDGAALNRLFAAGNNYKLTPGKTYKTTIPLLVPYTCQTFNMEGSAITFATTWNGGISSATSSVLTFGDTSNNMTRAIITGLNVYLPDASAANWSEDAGNAVVRLYNAISCYVQTIHLRGATIGLQVCSEAASGTLQSLYNTFILGSHTDNQHGLDLRSNTAACSVNQNTFIGGKFRNSSSAPASKDGSGIRYSFGTGGYQGNNNNKHINPSIELNPLGAGVRTPILMTSGAINCFENVRCETYTDHIARLSGTTCYRNVIDVAVYDGTLQMSDTSTSTLGVNRLRSVTEGMEAVPGWSSGPLIDRVKHYNSTDVSLFGICVAKLSDTAYQNASNIASTIVIPRRDWIEVTGNNAIGIYVDTSVHKAFRIWRNIQGSTGGRIRVNCYDSAGTIISDGTGVLNTNLTYSTNYGGSHSTTADQTASIPIRVSAATAFIRVLISAGSSSLTIRSFGVTPLDAITAGPLSVWANPVLAGPAEIKYAATIPSTYGRYALGDEVMNTGATTAISTGLRGWKCTTAGAFAPAWAATTAYVAGQLVLNDTNKIYWCKTAGTSAGSGGPTGNTEATDITDNTVTWRYLCPLAVFTTMYGESLPSQNGTVSTTDATVTTILTIPITTNAQTTLMVMVSARRTGGSAGAAADGASYIRGVSVKDNAGTPTIIGSSAMMTDQESQAGWDVTFDISTTNLRVRVTGAVNNNIDWSASARILAVT